MHTYVQIYIKEFFIFTSLSPLKTLNFANHSNFSRASASNWNPVGAEFVWNLLEFSDSHRHTHTHTHSVR